MSGHRYSVEFRIYGKTLDPASVTARLNLQPRRVREVGAPLSPTRASETAMWAYNGAEASCDHDWNSLEEGLSFVLEKLWPYRDVIATYKTNFALIWWCGHFQTSFDGGPLLSASLLKRLGEFGANLFIDNYFHDPAEGD